MTITYTTPVVQNDLTKRNLVGFAVKVLDRQVVCEFETGYLDSAGVFVKVLGTRRVFTEQTNPSFRDFLIACPAAAALRRQVELYETTLDRPGTVD